MLHTSPADNASVKKTLIAIHQLATLVLLASCGSAAAQSHGKQIVCDEIRQRYVVKQNRINSRTLNFLLFDAAERGCIDMMKRFLDLGASIEARNQGGNIALQLAARSGEHKAVKLLLELGSNVHHRNLAGSTALIQAAMADRRRVVRMLLRAGADPAEQNNRGITPLAAAAFNGSNRMVTALLEAGANPDIADRTGKTPIVYAAGRGYTDIVAAFLDAGVDVNARYSHDLTALMWAAGHSNDVPVREGVATVKLLIDRGAQLDLVDDRDRSALMSAVERDHAEIAALLIERGADMTLADRHGKTVLELARSAAVRSTLQAALEKPAKSAH